VGVKLVIFLNEGIAVMPTQLDRERTPRLVGVDGQQGVVEVK
jgi:hypothetical protein